MKTVVLWDYLISIDDEVGADGPRSYATDEPLGRLDLGKFQFCDACRITDFWSVTDLKKIMD